MRPIIAREQFTLQNSEQHKGRTEREYNIAERHRRKLTLEAGRVQPDPIEHSRKEDQHNLFGEYSDPQRDSGKHNGTQLAIASNQEQEREQQPEDPNIL